MLYGSLPDVFVDQHLREGLRLERLILSPTRTTINRLSLLQLLSALNKNTHVECTKITNLDSILFDQDDVELNNTSQYLSANVSQPVPLSYHYSSSIFNRPVINRPVSNRPVSNIIPNLGRSYNINNNKGNFKSRRFNEYF